MQRFTKKLLGTLIGLGLLLSCASCLHAQNPPAPAAKSHAAKHPKTKTPTGCGPTCGSERWPVKTLTDKDAAAVNLTPDTTKTVADLNAVPAPTTSSQDTRLDATEKLTFKVRARLVGYKQEFDPTSTKPNKGDRDFHIVIADLQDATKTMVVEIPDPACGGVCAHPSFRRSVMPAKNSLQSFLAIHQTRISGLYRATWKWM